MIRVALALVIVAATACRRPLPPERQIPDRGDREPTAQAEGTGRTGTGGASSMIGSTPPAVADSLVISPRAAAIIDSIEAAVRDSFAALVRDSVAAVARQDSIARAEEARAAAAEAAEAARQDSVARAEEARAAAEAARIAAAEAARQDSITRAEEARAATVEAARQDSIAAARASIPTDLEQLKALGPSFIPYDESPSTIWNTDTQAALSLALLPVLRKQGLSARTETVFWVLITREGDVEELVVQTSSGNEAFDAAAATFARTLTFIPAMRVNRPVPTWILREISILMR